MSKGSKRRPGDNQAFSDNYDQIFSGKITRGSFVQVTQEDGSSKFVPKSEAYLYRATTAPYVMNDMAEYISPIDGTRITSRSHHRAHVQQHGVIEVGNEKLKPPEAFKPTSAVEDIKRAMYEQGAL